MLFTWERAMDKVFWGNKRFADHFERYNFVKKFCDNKKVLDVACGSWYWTKLLSHVAKSITGLDVSRETIGFCTQNITGRNISFVLGDWKKLPFEDKTFDTIVSFETIEHVKDYHWFLSEIKRVLKDDGVLFISTPNFRWEIFKNKYHVSNFTTETFVAAVKKHLHVTNVFYQWTHYYPFPGRGILEVIFGIKRDIKIHEKKPPYEHHVTLIEARK